MTPGGAILALAGSSGTTCRPPVARQPLGRAEGAGGDIDTDVTIVIPAFNEAHRLPATLDRLFDELPGRLDGAWEIIVSDDGSQDATMQVVDDHADPRLRSVMAPSNAGKGAALLRGARSARYPIVAFLDADLPVPVDTLSRMAERMCEADLVVGSRRLPASTFESPQPLARRVGGRLFRAAISALRYDVTSDPQCGVKMLRRDSVVPLLDPPACEGFGFDVELIVRARSAGLRVEEVPVQWRHVEGSSLRPVRDGAATLRELLVQRSRIQRVAVVAR